MAAAKREPNVVVLGGGSWGTTVASICARRGPTLQWVRSEETAKDINENHRNTRYLGKDVDLVRNPARHHRLRRGRQLRRRHRDGGAVARVPRRAHRVGDRVAAMGAGGVVGQGARARHQHADVADRRRSAARPPRRHPGRAQHRPRGRRRLRGRGGAGDARPAPRRAARHSCSAPSVFACTPSTMCLAWRWPAH